MKGFPRDIMAEDLGSVVVVTLDAITGKIALVYEEAKGRGSRPVYWKCPGGMVEEKDVSPKLELRYNDAVTTKNAAEREVLEESGVELQVVLLLDTEKKSSRQGGIHLKHIFVGVGDFSTLKSQGDEGEIVKAFTIPQARALSNFFPLHERYLTLAEAKIRAL